MKNLVAYKKGLLFGLLNSLSTGAVGFVDKIGSTQTQSPLIFSVQSVCISFFFLLIFSLFYFNKSFLKSLKQLTSFSWINIFIVGIFASGLFILFRFFGLTKSSGTFATLSIIVTASLTALAAYFFLKERLNRLFWIFFVIILLSMYVVSTGQIGLATIKTGDAYILIGALLLTIANVSAKLAIKTTPPVLVTLGRFFFGGLFLLLINLLIFNQDNNLFNISIWVVLSGLLWSMSATLYNFTIKYLGVTLATTFLMLSPIYTLILEYIFLHHLFNPLQIVAVLVIVSCGILMFLPRNKSIPN